MNLQFQIAKWRFEVNLCHIDSCNEPGTQGHADVSAPNTEPDFLDPAYRAAFDEGYNAGYGDCFGEEPPANRHKPDMNHGNMIEVESDPGMPLRDSRGRFISRKETGSLDLRAPEKNNRSRSTSADVVFGGKRNLSGSRQLSTAPVTAQECEDVPF